MRDENKFLLKLWTNGELTDKEHLDDLIVALLAEVQDPPVHTFKRWAVWHPKLGFLTYSSYGTARPHKYPDPRGCFARRCDAEGKAGHDFYIPCDTARHSGADLKVVEVEFSWRVLDETAPA